MKQTEEKMKMKGIQVLKDIKGEYFRDQLFSNIFFNEKDLVLIGENKGKNFPTWTIVVNSLFDNHDFLIISDETGEPMYYANFNLVVVEIAKNEEGKYYRKLG